MNRRGFFALLGGVGAGVVAAKALPKPRPVPSRTIDITAPPGYFPVGTVITLRNDSEHVWIIKGTNLT